MDQLISDLTVHLSNPGEHLCETITSLLTNYQHSGDMEWKDYKFSNPHSYSRNLIHITELFEVVLLVWDQGQSSPIHNHNQSNCWFTVMEGVMNETKYQQGDDCLELTELETSTFSSGQVAAVTSDDDVLHKVFGFGATLHIYNPPIYKCNIYCPKTGKVEVRKPGFYTIHKKLLDSDIMIYKRIYDLLEEKAKKLGMKGMEKQ